MKIISWNVKGLGGVEKCRKVKECVEKHKLDIVGLQETKKEVLTSRLLGSVVGKDLFEWCGLPANGTVGGIVCVWNPVTVRKVREIIGNFSVSILLKDSQLGVEWLFTGVYGPPYCTIRLEF